MLGSGARYRVAGLISFSIELVTFMTTSPNTDDLADVLLGDVNLRPAGRADLLAVFRIEKAVFPQPWPFAAFERLLDVPAFLVAERTNADPGPGEEPVGRDGDPRGQVLGYIVGDVTPNNRRKVGHIKDLAVRPDEQGQGLGRILLETGLSRLAGAGASVVRLEVRASNEPARSLYESVGFDVVRQVPRYYEDGETAIVMLLEFGE